MRIERNKIIRERRSDESVIARTEKILNEATSALSVNQIAEIISKMYFEGKRLHRLQASVRAAIYDLDREGKIIKVEETTLKYLKK